MEEKFNNVAILGEENSKYIAKYDRWKATIFFWLICFFHSEWVAYEILCIISLIIVLL